MRILVRIRLINSSKFIEFIHTIGLLSLHVGPEKFTAHSHRFGATHSPCTQFGSQAADTQAISGKCWLMIRLYKKFSLKMVFFFVFRLEVRGSKLTLATSLHIDVARTAMQVALRLCQSLMLHTVDTFSHSAFTSPPPVPMLSVMIFTFLFSSLEFAIAHSGRQ